jgi:hypothetical protein
MNRDKCRHERKEISNLIRKRRYFSLPIGDVVVTGDVLWLVVVLVVSVVSKRNN